MNKKSVSIVIIVVLAENPKCKAFMGIGVSVGERRRGDPLKSLGRLKVSNVCLDVYLENTVKSKMFRSRCLHER